MPDFCRAGSVWGYSRTAVTTDLDAVRHPGWLLLSNLCSGQRGLLEPGGDHRPGWIVDPAEMGQYRGVGCGHILPCGILVGKNSRVEISHEIYQLALRRRRNRILAIVCIRGAEYAPKMIIEEIR